MILAHWLRIKWNATEDMVFENDGTLMQGIGGNIQYFEHAVKTIDMLSTLWQCTFTHCVGGL